MSLDWDVKLDSVSIRDEIASFTLNESKGSYVRELTLFSASSSFYSQFTYGDLPEARVEVLTKVGTAWVSQGFFYIEKPVFAVDPDSHTSPGVWGRSKTAILGTPFASKITKTWDTQTTCHAIIDEMAALGGITVIKEMDDYLIYPGTFVVEGKDPISVIQELVDYSNGYLGCNSSGELVIKKEVYHLSTSDHTLVDLDISRIDESIEYPEFGNRILIGAVGEGGYNVDVYSISTDCLQSDGSSESILLAFVEDSEGEVADEGTIVNWEETGGSGASLLYETSNIGTYFMEDKQHNSEGYNSIDVDYPIYSIIGIWAYSDTTKRNNFWDPYNTNNGFSEKTITLGDDLPFCDQTLVISYITYGCAINVVTSGISDIDVIVSADVQGEIDTVTIKQGKGCDCGGGSLDEFGTGLNMIVSPTSGVCLGNRANIMVWATVNGASAIGRSVTLGIFSGCGSLSSVRKTLGVKSISNEVGIVNNNISGVTRCTTDIIIDSSTSPTVYQFTEDDDGIKTQTGSNLYSSYNGMTIDLNTILPTGTEVLINYSGSGVALSSWLTEGLTEACNVVISAFMADGSEAGLYTTVSTSAADCTLSDTIPDTPNGDSTDDPDDWDDDGNDGGSDPSGDSGTILSVCDLAILNRIGGKEAAVTDEEITINRFQSEECVEDSEDLCPCDEMCLSEMFETGSTYDNPGQTISQSVIEAGFVEGTPEYEEAYEVEKTAQLEVCEAACELARESACACSGESIGFTTQGMAVGEEQTLSVASPVSGITYSWAITAGGGTLSEETEFGLSVLYTSPATNPNCLQNPTIELKFEGATCDSLDIAVSITSTTLAYVLYDQLDLDFWAICSNSPGWGCRTRVHYMSCVDYEKNALVTWCHPTDSISCNTYYGGKQNCIDNCYVGAYDVRTPTDLAAGCCPEALL